MQGTVKYQKKIMVWGCFSWSGVGRLYRINGIMDRFKYRQILIHQMRPSGRVTTLSSHRTATPSTRPFICRNYLVNQGMRSLFWPAQSPDLNPMENLWSELDRRLRKRKCNTEEELFELLKTAWNYLDAEYLQSLIASMPKRCAEVVKSGGYPIDY